MKRLFEAVVPRGFLELYEADGKLVFISAFRKGAAGVGVEMPPEEAADLAEALLRHLGPDTALSVFAAAYDMNRKFLESMLAKYETKAEEEETTASSD